MSIDNMIAQFKEFSELQSYADSQYKTIVELSKKIQKIEEENKHLKHLVEIAAPLDSKDKINIVNIGVSDNQEMICLRQLETLRNYSDVGELTLEQTKKVEIYSKILHQLKNNKNPIDVSARSLDETQLLDLLGQNETKT